MKNDKMNDGEILEQLFRLYEQQMYRIAYGILNNSHQADAFERLIPYLGECNGLTDLRTKRLIAKIIKSTAVDIYRKNKRESMILSVDAGDFTEPGVDTIDACIRQKDCEEMADKIIEELPEIYAGVVRLRFFYGLEIVEIAEIRCTYTHDGSFGRKGFWVLQETSREIINNYVESYEQSMIGDMEALVLTPQMTDSTSTYRQVIYLFNPQDMVLLMVGSDDPQLSAEELKKVAESVSYEPAGEKIMAYSTSTLPVQKEMTLADRSFDKDQVKDSFLVESYDGQKVQVNVKDISFLDTISGLNKNNFYDSENLENYVYSLDTWKNKEN